MLVVIYTDEIGAESYEVKILAEFIKSIHKKEVSLVLHILNEDEVDEFDYLPKVMVYLGNHVIGELYDLSRLDILEGYIEKALGLRRAIEARISRRVLKQRYLR